MYLACPSCKATYRIQPEHLQLAGGQVRCGRCRATFSAAGAACDDPREALARAEARAGAGDIDALINRALERVSSSSQHTARNDSIGPLPAAPTPVAATNEQAAVVAPERSSSPGDTAPGAVAHSAQTMPAPDQAGVVPDEPVQEAEPPPQDDGGAVVPPSEASEQDGFDWSRLPGDETSQVWPDVESDGGAGAIDDVSLSEPQTPADLDFYAQPALSEVAAVSYAGERPEALSDPLLLEDLYEPGISRRTWGAAAAVLLLLALLVVQYGYAHRYRLADQPRLRPALELACLGLGCDLPLRHDAGKVEILAREVRDHPEVPDALLINVSFANRADFAQTYPVFEVSFSDFSGTPVAARRFSPEEYLADAHQAHTRLEPGQHASLKLEVLDPGDRAVSFQFEFL